ncbi:EamA family transporter [Tessaracoccus antarcticus]|uniref:EamA family transporter n=1 Tax=Tessaracoccus antarcticus TaxID=2479848 RepID=A0A3M0GCC3_9ACTN|nr:EamA family transporter [Tessaracoccus antarcticus]RMB58749.1 EamA family transporter [Tessaracoccus antarcticus]
MDTPTPRIRPELLLLVSIASVQLGSSFAKQLFELAPPWIVVWLRILSSGVVLSVVAPPRLSGRTRLEWRRVLVYALSLTLMNVSFVMAISRIPIGVAVTFEFIGPLAVAVAGSRKAREYLWAGLAAVGVALLGFAPGALDVTGVLLALLAGAFWAAYIVAAGPAAEHWSGVTAVTISSWVGAVLLLPVVLATLSSGTTQWAMQPRVWLWGLALGLLGSVIPYALELRALRTMDRGVFGIMMSLEPGAAALLAWLVLGEDLRPVEVAAMVCVVAASMGALRGSRAAPDASLKP